MKYAERVVPTVPDGLVLQSVEAGEDSRDERLGLVVGDARSFEIRFPFDKAGSPILGPHTKCQDDVRKR